MKRTDCYKILQLNNDASFSEIKNSYIKLTKKFHPDKNKDMDTSHKFKQIQMAYKILTNDKNIGRVNNDSNIKKNDTQKIFDIYQKTIQELCDKYNFSPHERNEIIDLFNSDDYLHGIQENNLTEVYSKLLDKISIYLPRFLLNRITNIWKNN